MSIKTFEVELGSGFYAKYQLNTANGAIGRLTLETPATRLEGTPEQYARDRLGRNWEKNADAKAREMAKRLLEEA